MNRPVFVVVLLVVATSAACPAPTGAEVGKRLFSDARFSDSEFNSFSCATCHGTTADAVIRSTGAKVRGLRAESAECEMREYLCGEE